MRLRRYAQGAFEPRHARTEIADRASHALAKISHLAAKVGHLTANVGDFAAKFASHIGQFASQQGDVGAHSRHRLVGERAHSEHGDKQRGTYRSDLHRLSPHSRSLL